MSISTASLSTDRARRYLQQLCKHFGHKVPVEFVPATGRITFPFGTCTLRTDGASLILVADSEGADLDRLEQIVGDHLARFAFREQLAVTWQRSAGRSPPDSLEGAPES